jgi:uncharacterized membrane protein
MPTDDETAPAARAGKAGRPPRRRAVLNLLSIAGNLEYDRVLFFSDAVFAIAMTLLAVNIRVPDLVSSALTQLQDSLPRIFGFAISFVVIGLFWIGHHTTFRHITALDRTIIWVNLLFLGLIAFLPYPTALLSAPLRPGLSPQAADASRAAATIFYAVCVSAAGLAQFAIWLYALRAGLVSARVTRPLRRYFAARMLRTPVVFLLSIPVAVVSPNIASYVWLLVVVVGFASRRILLRDEVLREEVDEES